MKNIAPIVYTTGGPTATRLRVWGLNDTYGDTAGPLTGQCDFGWQLITEEGEVADSGQINCSGSDYAGWAGDNNFPYTWVAANLSTPLTIIP
jgi:hypothetical protein